MIYYLCCDVMKGRKSELEISVSIHRPQEFAEVSVGEHLFHTDFVLLAPGHRDARVVVVCLARAQRELLAIVLLFQQF